MDEHNSTTKRLVSTLEESLDALHAQTPARDPPRVYTTAKRTKPKPLIRTIVPAQNTRPASSTDQARETVTPPSESQQLATHSKATQTGFSEHDHGARSNDLHEKAKEPQAQSPYRASGTQIPIDGERNGIVEGRSRASKEKARVVIEEYFLASDQQETESSGTWSQTQTENRLFVNHTPSSFASPRGKRKRALPSAPVDGIQIDESEEADGGLLRTSISTARTTRPSFHNNSRLGGNDPRHSAIVSRDVSAACNGGGTLQPRPFNLPGLRASMRESPFMGNCERFIDEILEDERDTLQPRHDAELTSREEVNTQIRLGIITTMHLQPHELAGETDESREPASGTAVPGSKPTPIFIDLTFDDSGSSDGEEAGTDAPANNHSQVPSGAPDNHQVTTVRSSSVGSSAENGFPYICKPPKAKKAKAWDDGSYLLNKFLVTAKRRFRESVPEVVASSYISMASLHRLRLRDQPKRPGRKAWFGKAAERQQWAQEHQDAHASWGYPHRRDFGMSMRIQQKTPR